MGWRGKEPIYGEEAGAYEVSLQVSSLRVDVDLSSGDIYADR